MLHRPLLQLIGISSLKLPSSLIINDLKMYNVPTLSLLIKGIVYVKNYKLQATSRLAHKVA